MKASMETPSRQCFRALRPQVKVTGEEPVPHRLSAFSFLEGEMVRLVINIRTDSESTLTFAQPPQPTRPECN